MKQSTSLFISFVFFLLFSCSSTEPIQQKKQSFPSDKEACLEQNGSWRAYGLRRTFSCRITNNDFNKVCANHSDCKGVCIAKESGSKLGQCSKHTPNYGCSHLLNNGKTVHICAD